MQKRNLKDLFSGISDFWSPKIIGAVNDQYVKIAKLKGEFIWHAHRDEDEMFFIYKGSLAIEMENETVHLEEGEFYIVPKGVRHRPFAKEECWVMLIEQKSTKHTGEVKSKLTRTIEDQR